MSQPILGFDGYPGGWVCAVLVDGRVQRVFAHPVLAGAVLWIEEGRFAFADAAAIGVDMPVTVPDHGARRADSEARRFIRPLGSSVFSVPPLPALTAADYDSAVVLAREHGGPAPSRQCFALFPKIREARALQRLGHPLYEVHPEVSFRFMAGSPLAPKRSHTGVMQRMELLQGRGLDPPVALDDAGIGRPVPAPAIQDVLDAIAVAWSAARVAAGMAATLPAEPTDEERAANMLVWY